MLKYQTYYVVIPLILFLSFLLPPAVSAKDGALSLRLWGEALPFISGEAGTGTGAPDYVDAFKTGMGMGGELSWRFSNRFSCLAGIGYEVYNGDEHQDISFDSLKIVPVYLGGKFHIIPDDHRWDPYVRIDIGAAHLSSVNISYLVHKAKYWDSSWVFLFDFGGGIEYRMGSWGASLEFKPRYLGKPDPALGRPSKAGSSWTIPIVFGINYHF